MTSETIRQFMRMFSADANLHGGKHNELWHKTAAHDETVAGAIFYPWRDRMDDVPLQMVPYFVTCHVNCHTVLHYIDAVQSIGLPGDPCPMCQAEAGLSVLDDMPDYFPFLVTSNEACDGSVGTSILQDWAYDRPLFAMPQPMQFDDPRGAGALPPGDRRMLEVHRGADGHALRLRLLRQVHRALQRAHAL